MTPNQKRSIRRWHDALISGQYEQHYQSLANASATAFCCLGVLCSVEGYRFHPDPEGAYIQTAGGREDKSLPYSLAVDGRCYPVLKIPAHLRHDGLERESAITLNDEYEFTFAELAECIRETWPEAWEEEA